MRSIHLVFASLAASVTMAATACAEETEGRTRTTCTANGAESLCALGVVSGPLAGSESTSRLATEVSIELKADDEESLLAKDADVRAAILTTIQATPESAATTHEGQLKLREGIHKAIDRALVPVRAERVYFTAWGVEAASK